jgi:hypothetical protein
MSLIANTPQLSWNTEEAVIWLALCLSHRIYDYSELRPAYTIDWAMGGPAK